MATTTAPRRTLVLALGNPLCGDDGFGAAVLEQLRSQPDVRGAADLVDAGTDLLGRLHLFDGREDVIIMDAVMDAGIPGQVEVFAEETFSGWPETSTCGHQISPLLALKLFRILHPESRIGIRLVALCVDRITMTQGASQAGAVRPGVQAVRRLLVL